jgi:hypothetical protein
MSFSIERYKEESKKLDTPGIRRERHHHRPLERASCGAVVPIMQSGRMPASMTAWSIPTWMAPRLPPPDSTKAVLPAPCAALRLIAAVGSAAASSGLLFRPAVGTLGAKRLDHHGGVDAIPQSPVGLRAPHLVEQRLELAVQIGVC